MRATTLEAWREGIATMVLSKLEIIGPMDFAYQKFNVPHLCRQEAEAKAHGVDIFHEEWYIHHFLNLIPPFTDPHSVFDILFIVAFTVYKEIAKISNVQLPSQEQFSLHLKFHSKTDRIAFWSQATCMRLCKVQMTIPICLNWSKNELKMGWQVI